MEDKVIDLAVAAFVFILWRWDNVRYERRLKELQRKHDGLLKALVQIQHNIKKRLMLVIEENTQSLKSFSILAYRMSIADEQRDKRTGEAIARVEDVANRLEEKMDKIFTFNK